MVANIIPMVGTDAVRAMNDLHRERLIRGGTAFVGRGAALRRLERVVQEAGDGAPAAVLLAGDAGVGKTRLAATEGLVTGPDAADQRLAEALRRGRSAGAADIV